MKLIFKKLKSVIIAMIIILIVCTLVTIYSVPNNKLSISVNNANKYPVNGYGVALISKNNDIIKDNIINISGDKFNYNLRFINNSGIDNSFTIMVYLNYQQIPFKIEEKDITNYKFNLKTGSEIDLPISFSIKDLPFKNNSLVFSVISGAEKHSDDVKEISDFYGTSVRYSLLINKSNLENDKFLEPEKDLTIKRFKTNKFTGIILNNDNEIFDRFLTPSKVIKAKAGEEFKLYLRAGGFSDAEDFVTWITVGWRQEIINTDSGRTYLYFHVPTGEAVFKEISLKAPKEKGKYEICGFLSNNPWLPMNSPKIQGSTFYTSYRITLDVE